MVIAVKSTVGEPQTPSRASQYPRSLVAVSSYGSSSDRRRSRVVRGDRKRSCPTPTDEEGREFEAWSRCAARSVSLQSCRSTALPPLCCCLRAARLYVPTTCCQIFFCFSGSVKLLRSSLQLVGDRHYCHLRFAILRIPTSYTTSFGAQTPRIALHGAAVSCHFLCSSVAADCTGLVSLCACSERLFYIWPVLLQRHTFTEERPVVTYGRSCYCLCAVTSDCYLCFAAHSLQGSGLTLSTHFIGPLVDLFRSAYAGDTSSSVLLFLKSCSFLISLHWWILLARRPRGFGSSLGGGGGGDFEDFLGWLSASYRIFSLLHLLPSCDWRRLLGRSGEYSSEWSRRPTQGFVAVYEVSMQLRIWWRPNGLKFGSRR